MAMVKDSDQELDEVAKRISILRQSECELESGRRTPWVPDSNLATLEEERECIISISEFLALLGFLATQADDCHANGVRVVLYAGDNDNVKSWIEKRQANNELATHGLYLLAAIAVVHAVSAAVRVKQR